MSYDISLINKNTNETLTMSCPQFISGGTVRAEIDPISGKLVPAKQIETDVNITYNYSKYYYDIYEKGIREIYGKTANESLNILIKMIKSIRKKYQVNGEWIISDRVKKEFYDLNGNKLDITDLLGKDIQYTEKEIKYQVSEGDTSNYWEATAANAIIPLTNMIHMAVEYIDDDNAIWDGD